MPLVRQAVPSLLGGVSQQPSAARQLDQCESAVNTWPSPVDGLTKRQPIDHVALLNATADSDRLYHYIDRGPDEKYLIAFKSGAVEAYDLQTGASRVVRDIPATSFAYLSGLTDGAKNDLDALTVADYTFVTNKRTTVAMSSTNSPAAGTNRGYVWLRQPNYGTTYTVRIKPAGGSAEEYSIKTWDGNTSIAGSSATPVWPSPTELDSIQTEDIMEQLKLGIDNMAGSWTASRVGSCIEVDYSSELDTIETRDSVGDSVLVAVFDQEPAVAGYLPKICRDGFRIKVVGEASIAEDDYYVKFTAQEGTGVFGEGEFQEDIGYDEEKAFDPLTMPHTLVRRFDDGSGTITGTPNQAYFDWDVGAWEDKLVGDSTLVPRPAFVGEAIQEAVFYKGRLGFFSQASASFSNTDQPFNFWRNTLYTLEDTAAFDVTVNHSPVAILTEAAIYNENLLVKSARTQFIIRGSDIFSPRTVEVVPVSEYEGYVGQDFLPAGRSVFFGFKRGSQSGIRELFQIGDSENFDATDITGHVPNYIEGTIDWMAATTLEETLVVKASGHANRLYIYKYLWGGQQKLLSSWGVWEADSDSEILSGYFVDNTLYLVVQHTTGSTRRYLEKVEIASGRKDLGTNWITHVDRRFDQSTAASITYSAATNQTTFTLPYSRPTNATVEVVEKITGIRFQVISTTETSVIVRGDLTSVDFWCGLRYTMSYEFSKPLIRPAAGNGRAPSTGQQARTRQLALEFHTSGRFDLTGQNANRTVYTYPVADTEATYSQTVVGSVELKTGNRTIPILGRTEQATARIVNSGPYPSNITSAEWLLYTHRRAPRLP